MWIVYTWYLLCVHVRLKATFPDIALSTVLLPDCITW